MEEKFKPSPIPKGGLEIILKATLMKNEKSYENV